MKQILPFKYIIALCVLLWGSISGLMGQKKVMQITLSDAQILAQSKSLQSFLDRHNFLADYWAFKSYRSERLPYLSLYTKPIAYSNATSLRYNSVTRYDEYVRTENIQSYANLNLSQKVGMTGGTIYAESELSRIENFGTNRYTQFSSNPFTIGYKQNLFGFNAMKWEKLIEPLKFEKAKREYLESTEGVLLDMTYLFFNLLKAQEATVIAKTNQTNTIKVLDVATKRLALGTVTKDELLDLMLSKNNAEITLREANIDLRSAKEEILNYLMLPVETDLIAQLPMSLVSDSVNISLVLDKAIKNNPLPLSIEQNIIESRRDLAEVRNAQRFQANMNLSYGVNKTDGRLMYENNQLVPVNGELGNVYKPEFDKYQQVSLTVSVPILDWGTGKGLVEMARSRQQVVELSAKKSRQQFEQSVITKAVTFNLQKEKVSAAAVSDSLAQDSYELTMTRFNNGKADVLKLNVSQQAKDNARMQYINAIAGYWIQYFTLRKLTLFDFEKNEDVQLFDLQSIGK